MFETESKTFKGTYPNIILKKKLAPLPLLNQNQSPKKYSFLSPNRERPPAGLIHTRLNSESKQLSTTLGSPKHKFLTEVKNLNNYGRLCDQPFLECSRFHLEQVFGSEPLQNKKEKKQKVDKLFTLKDSTEATNKEPLIKIQDNVLETANQDNNKENSDNQTTLKKMYMIENYEAVIGFYNFEIILESTDETNKREISLYLGKEELKKIYRHSEHNIIELILDSLVLSGEKLQIKIKKDKCSKADHVTGEETYPEKRENLSLKLNDIDYNVTIIFPYLEISIQKLNFRQKIMLKPLYLANLFEEKFDNLQDYVPKFDLPPEITKGKEGMHYDELKKLPTIIKKVTKDDDFAGVMIFKSLEIHLKNTSNIEPETIMHESTLTVTNQKILKRKKKDVNSVVLRLNLCDLGNILKCTVEELIDLIKESIAIEEGKGFSINLNEEKVAAFNKRHEIETDFLPEYSPKFTIRFQRFLYEGFIKFPTLELYIPETSYKDLIQLRPYQIKDLLDSEFKNMNNYMHYFKKPMKQEQLPEIVTEKREEESAQAVNEKDANEVSIDGKILSYKQHSLNFSNR